ncbi:MAG: starch-binding protein [Muribaculaceae bacterium]|nr:starch-binding protein [Muribaculaceae bacterium]
MIKKLFSYFALLLFLAGCSDEIAWDRGSVFNSDGSIDIILSVPEMTVVTRADGVEAAKNEVSTIQMLVFQGTADDSRLEYSRLFTVDGTYQFTETTQGTGENTKTYYMVHVDLSKEMAKKPALGFYFIANPPEDFTITNPKDDPYDDGSETAIANRMKFSELKYKLAKIEDTSGRFVMSGKYAGTLNGLKGTTINLNRNAAKVTVNAAVEKGADDYEKDPLTGRYVLGEAKYPFEVYGCANTTSIIAGAEDILGAARNVQEFNFDGDALSEYVRPTKNSGSLPIVVVQAQYDGKDYYYALAMKKKEIDEEYKENITDIDFLPNHWYQIVIKKVKAPGASSPQEAALAPIVSSETESAAIDWTIHDHSPEVYNMISDGTRELGVSTQVFHGQGATSEGEWENKYFYVKVFDHDNQNITFQDLINPQSKYYLKVTEDTEWLEISDPEDASDMAVPNAGINFPDGSTIGGGIPSGDSNDNSKGIVVRYNTRFIATSQLGTVNSTINVSWQGLVREIPVVWSKNFNGSDLCDVTLRIYNGSAEKEFETSKYWDLLDGKQVSYNGSNVVLYGLDKNNNGEACRGLARYEGLHFPVMYGSGTNKWYYEYDVKYTAFKAEAFKWYVTLHGDAVVKNNVKVEFDGNPLTATSIEDAKSCAVNTDLNIKVKRSGNVSDADYGYGTGQLRLHIVDPVTNEEKGYYDIQLYHTGFFHKNTSVSETNRKDTDGEGYGDKTNWYYYEVVPVAGPTGTRYMLDRNLGAKSAEFYISNAGSRIAGPDKAPGGYYKVATKKSNYEGTQMIAGICPPGYDIPSQPAWDAIRKSNDFHNISSDGVAVSCYETGRSGRIYFPKMEYKDGDSWAGQVLAGYYWTTTECNGLEKQEIGRWLKALSFAGTATSFVNGNVENFTMPVRCINKVDESSLPTYETYINVAGATHVYLYTLENGKPVGMTTWPGQAVGNYNNMAGQNNWFQYIFQSKTVRPEDLYVVFNFLNSDGTIYTYANNGKGYSLTPDSAEGWKVVNDPDGNIKDSTPAMADWIGVPTQNNYYWQWQHDYAPSASVSNKLYCYNYKPGIRKPVPMYEMRILWPKYVSGNECKQIRIWNTVTSDWEYGYEDGYKEQQGHGWTNFNQDGYSYDNNGAYYYNPEIPKVNKNVPMLIFVKKDNNVYVTKNTYKLGEFGTANNNLLHLHDSDFKVYNGSTDVVKYYLTLGSSGEKEMTESGSNWTLSNLSGSGDLKIYRKTNRTTDLYVKLNGSSLDTTGTVMNTTTQTSSVNVGNISASGTYSFTYNPTANTLTITGGTTPTKDTYTIYYTNPNGWSDVYVYSFNGGTEYNGGWPGKKMTWDSSVNKYTAEVNKNASTIIFNNNNDKQTANIELVQEDKHTYVNPYGQMVYFLNNGNWSNVYIYTWDDSENKYNGDWPGTKLTETMEESGKKYYKIRIDSRVTKIIFNNNNGAQTSNFDKVENGKYDKDSKLN